MKKRIIFGIVLLSMLTACTDKNIETNTSNTNINQNIINEVVEEPKVYTTFFALGKTYEGTKNIYDYNEGDTIYDNMSQPQYVVGEYKEIDFAFEFLKEYLAKNPEVYNYMVSQWDNDSDEVELISGEAKQKSIDEVNFLGEQFMLTDADPIYFKLGKVILQEKSQENNMISLELRGYLSATNGNFRPLGTFTVTVYTKEDKLYGSIL